MSDLQRITSDIARCKEKISQMESGERGVISEGYRHVDAGRAFEAQLHAQRQALERFELEYLQAKLGRGWNAADVIARMEAPAPAQAPAPVQPLTLPLTLPDATRARLADLLEDNPGNFIPRSKLAELLHE